jgi:hypothetical protein
MEAIFIVLVGVLWAVAIGMMVHVWWWGLSNGTAGREVRDQMRRLRESEERWRR